jgi:hypothetical protein
MHTPYINTGAKIGLIGGLSEVAEFNAEIRSLQLKAV